MLRKLINIFWTEFYAEFNKQIRQLYLDHNIVPRRWKPQGVIVEVLPPKEEK